MHFASKNSIALPVLSSTTKIDHECACRSWRPRISSKVVHITRQLNELTEKAATACSTNKLESKDSSLLSAHCTFQQAAIYYCVGGLAAALSEVIIFIDCSKCIACIRLLLAMNVVIMLIAPTRYADQVDCADCAEYLC